MTPRRALLFLLALASPLGADELVLTDGSQLTGRIRSLGADGRIQLESDLGIGPVEVLAGHVKRIDFASGRRHPAEHDARITLTNGDRLPCNLNAIDDAVLRVGTTYAGDLVVPRDFVRSLKLGIRPARVIYQGPANLAGWEADENWSFSNGTLISAGPGGVSREIDMLPRSFALSFEVAWTGRPNLVVYFCADTRDVVSGRQTDRYFLQFGPGGVGLKRQNSGRRSHQTLADIGRSPDAFPENKAHFEIRVDRRNRRLLLYIDGELEGRYDDPFSKVPPGKLLVFHSNAHDSNAHRISHIEVREWDAAGERHESEDRGDVSDDAVINNEGDRISGRLLTSQGEPDHLKLLFKSVHQPDPLEIPASDVSTLFLREAEADDVPEQAVVLALAERGRLSGGDCRLTKDTFRIVHPLLGPLELSRDALRQFERRDPPPSGDSGDESEPEETP